MLPNRHVEEQRGNNPLTAEKLKKQICAAIEARREEIIDLGERLFRCPELGYREHRTAAVIEEQFRNLGLAWRRGVAITGLKAVMHGRESRVRAGVIGEMDAIRCYGHPAADPHTGAAHACGHHAGLAAMVGVAMGLLDSGAMEHLDGDVVLMALPAEEFVDMEFRQKLQQEGKIRFLGGKQEWIARGEFDDVDLCMMVHLESDLPERIAKVGGSSNGFLGKSIRYLGREAHAGASPHEGINALNAALLGIIGIHLQRETFREADTIRIHPIITRGGDLVNIVPADVRLETYVRGRTMEAIASANQKVNRALQAGALAIGCRVEIQDFPGYLPLRSDERLSSLFARNSASLIGEENVLPGDHMTGSTDMGDVSQLMPSIHPSIGGTRGRCHTSDFSVVDAEMAYVIPAKAMAMSLIDLLANGAREGLAIKNHHRPSLGREGYLRVWQDILGEDLAVPVAKDNDPGEG